MRNIYLISFVYSFLVGAIQLKSKNQKKAESKQNMTEFFHRCDESFFSEKNVGNKLSVTRKWLIR